MSPNFYKNTNDEADKNNHNKNFSVVGNKMKSLTVVVSIIAVLFGSVPSISMAAGRVDEPPTPMAMIGDVMTRPVMAVATVIGTGLFLATLPFSLIGGNAGQVGGVLVVEPFKATFMRCLGCTNANSDSFGGTRPVE